MDDFAARNSLISLGTETTTIKTTLVLDLQQQQQRPFNGL